jgi:coenzyme F420 biosynthesis associated uncharacterized protein
MSQPADRAAEPAAEPAAEMVDWDLAVRVASRLAGQGPVVSPAEASEAVAELRADADRSTGLVREFTGLVAADHSAPVLVVDRAGWIQANADAFRHLVSPLVDQISAKKAPSGLTLAVGSRVTGLEVGGLLGFLSGKVLGQFDPFHAPDGRLLLVAPNIVHVEREIGADPTDFRLWVCLHEETHRVQFTAVPWMRDHLFSEVQALSATVSPSGVDEMVRRLTQGLKGGIGQNGIVDLLSTPEQRAILDRVTGMMSLLEGHADVVMDGVGPSVIPTVDDIRKSFTRRRQGVGALDRLLRRLLGLDAKMAQYRDGAQFVRAVVDKVGMAEFNTVWERAEHLPSKAELSDPEAWVSRVLG